MLERFDYGLLRLQRFFVVVESDAVHRNLLLELDDLSHELFMSVGEVESEVYVVLRKRFLELSDVPPHLYHIFLDPFMDAPVRTEYLIQLHDSFLKDSELLLDGPKLCDDAAFAYFPLVLHQEDLLMHILQRR